MLINYLPQPLRVVGSIGLLIAVLILAACGGAAAVPEVADDPTAQGDAAAPGETEAVQEAEPTQAPQVAQATEEAAPVQEVASAPASCEPVLVPENELVAAPTEDDWSKGPATAVITVIEYGDFQ